MRPQHAQRPVQVIDRRGGIVEVDARKPVDLQIQEARGS